MPDDSTRRLAAQFAVDRVQIENRRILGDDLAVPREVEHFAVFPSKQAALEAAEQLGRAGFTGSTLSVSERHSILAVRMDALDEESVRMVVREVSVIVESHGGQYDGWGAAVVLARRPFVQIPDSPDDIHWT